MENELVFVPLGGVGEIGMNLGLYGFGPAKDRRWLMVDCGVTFGDAAETPGIDLILPDIRFIEAQKKNLVGLVLTHAHEDHFGAVIDLLPRLNVPVIATPFTAALLEAKALGERNSAKLPIQVAHPGAPFQLGPFSIEFVRMAHSIPEANALAIRTEAGLVVHTGDWRIDPDPMRAEGRTDRERLIQLGEEGVLAVIGDSTNAVRDGFSISERDVAESIGELIRSAPGRVAVTTFASHIPRIRSVAEAGQAAGREVVVVGRAMARTVEVARETGWLGDVADFRAPDVYGYLPPDKALLILTGSQGEPRAALARIAAGDHPEITLSKGDRLIFSSRTIPGNERGVNRIINALIDRGIEVITDRTHTVHVSGHPRRGEMTELYSWLKPQAVVPVHGEALHLHEHRKLARSLGIPNVANIRNGDILRLAPGELETVGEAPFGRMYKDGKLLDPSDEPVRERRRLAFGGVVSVALALNASGDVVADPEVAVSGLPERDEEGESLLSIITEVVEETLENLPRARRRDPDSVAEALRRAVRAELKQAWGKKPLCQILVLPV